MDVAQPTEIPPPHIIRRLAAAADADPRTVRRFLQGKAIHGSAVAERIARAVAAWRAAERPAGQG